MGAEEQQESFKSEVIVRNPNRNNNIDLLSAYIIARIFFDRSSFAQLLQLRRLAGKVLSALLWQTGGNFDPAHTRPKWGKGLPPIAGLWDQGNPGHTPQPSETFLQGLRKVVKRAESPDPSNFTLESGKKVPSLLLSEDDPKIKGSDKEDLQHRRENLRQRLIRVWNSGLDARDIDSEELQEFEMDVSMASGYDGGRNPWPVRQFPDGETQFRYVEYDDNPFFDDNGRKQPWSFFSFLWTEIGGSALYTMSAEDLMDRLRRRGIDSEWWPRPPPRGSRGSPSRARSPAANSGGSGARSSQSENLLRMGSSSTEARCSTEGRSCLRRWRLLQCVLRNREQ